MSRAASVWSPGAGKCLSEPGPRPAARCGSRSMPTDTPFTTQPHAWSRKPPCCSQKRGRHLTVPVASHPRPPLVPATPGALREQDCDSRSPRHPATPLGGFNMSRWWITASGHAELPHVSPHPENEPTGNSAATSTTASPKPTNNAASPNLFRSLYR